MDLKNINGINYIYNNRKYENKNKNKNRIFIRQWKKKIKYYHRIIY